MKKGWSNKENKGNRAINKRKTMRRKRKKGRNGTNEDIQEEHYTLLLNS